MWRHSQVETCGPNGGFTGQDTLQAFLYCTYADETMFFMEGSMEEGQNPSTLLDLFRDLCSISFFWVWFVS